MLEMASVWPEFVSQAQFDPALRPMILADSSNFAK